MHRRIGPCLAALIATIPATALAGNDDEILIGTQGARLGGAVTATVTDSTALWYNPGAIGRTRWAQFGVSGTLVQARVHRSDAGGNDVDLAVVPATLGHEIPLPNDWAFGYGIFTSQSQPETTASPARRTHNFGAGLGAPLASNLRIGLALFAVHTAESALSTSGGFAFEALAAFASAGLHWAPNANWNLGLAVNSPRMLLLTDTLVPGGSTDPGFSASAPMRVRAGIAHNFGRLVVSLDGDVQPALRNRDAFVDRRFVPNARVGLDYTLDEQTRLGLGLFTDMGAERDDNLRMDFLGVAGGVESTTRYRLANDETASSIEISAFIGFRYAYGARDTLARDLTTHEFGINLGSGLRF